jgi:hypothetical protein
MATLLAVPSKARVNIRPHDVYSTLPVTRITLVEDSVTPDIFFGTIVQGARPHTEDSGERRLMLAVLEDAIASYQKTARPNEDRRKRRAFADVEAWIASRDTIWPFSFENICAVLDIDADNLRQGLSRWRAKQLAAVPLLKASRRMAGRRTQIIVRRMRKDRQ